MHHEGIIDLLQGRLRAIGAKSWPGVAEATGIKYHQLRKIAYGDRSNPTLSTVEPLLRYFDLMPQAESAPIEQPQAQAAA